MKIIYSCYWGSYLAVVAALLHLDELNGCNCNDMIVEFHKIKQPGELYLMGKDDKGQEIYVLGAKNAGRVIKKTLKGISEIFGLGKYAVIFVDLNKHSNYYIYFGGLLIQKYNMQYIGMKLVTIGIKKVIKELRKIVMEVKKKVG